MLSLFLTGKTILIIFFITYITMIVLKLFKIDVSKRIAISSEFLLIGFGLILLRKPSAAFFAFLLSIIPKYFYKNLYPDIMSCFKEGNLIGGFLFMGVVVLSVYFVVKKTIHHIQFNRFNKNKPSKSSSRPSNYSNADYFDDDDKRDRDTIRDHMEFHHHDSHMP